MSEHIVIERRGAVQSIRMNRPDKKNALTRDMYAAMAGALRSGDADPQVRCHVLLGVPGAFSAGNDLADFLAVAQGGENGTEVWDFLLALAECEKPLLAGADGIAVGVGTTMLFHCDLTLATPRTVFHTPFVDLGVVPEAGSSLLAPPLFGRQGAFALLALGEGLPAEKALAAGMIYRVVSEAELDVEVFKVAEAVAAKPPEAMKLARNLMLGDRAALIERMNVESGHFRERLKSDEARNAFMAFMTRKK